MGIAFKMCCLFHKDEEPQKQPWMELRFDHSRPSQNQTEERLQWIMKQKIEHVIKGN